MQTVYEWYEQIDSTQNRAAEWAENGAPHGAFVGAEQQTNGRGRNGRVWHSPAGAGIYVSWVFRMPVQSERLPWLPLIAAAAVAESIRALPSSNRLHAFVKWPNDLYVGQRKIGGLLVDAKVNAGRLRYAIIGLGLSIHHTTNDLPESDRSHTTSWHREGIVPPTHDDLLQSCHQHLMNAFEIHFKDPERSLSELRRYVKSMMPRVKIELPFRLNGTIVQAIPFDLDEQLRLLIELEDGARHWLEVADANTR